MTADAGAGRDSAAGVDVQDLRPITRPESVALARTETERMVALLRSLTPDDWSSPHRLFRLGRAGDGRARARHDRDLHRPARGSSPRWSPASARPATDRRSTASPPSRSGPTPGLSTAELVRRMEVAGPRQARWRGRRRLMRAIPMTEELPGGRHRALATGLRAGHHPHPGHLDAPGRHRPSHRAPAGARPPSTTGGSSRTSCGNGPRRHGQPFRLQLTGPAGGAFVGGTQPTLGRAPGAGRGRVLPHRVRPGPRPGPAGPAGALLRHVSSGAHGRVVAGELGVGVVRSCCDCADRHLARSGQSEKCRSGCSGNAGQPTSSRW